VNVLIAGAAGQVGRSLRRAAPDGAEVLPFDRTQLDISDERQVETVLRQHRPDVVINAAAYTQVDRAESEPGQAFQVNEFGARNLARGSLSVGARLVHISTNYVFAGDRALPYGTDVEAGPLSAYGRSKLAGERVVSDVLGDRCVIIRTSWVYERSGSNFVSSMLNQMRSRDSIGVVYDQVATPTWAMSVAQAIWAIVGHEEVHGVQHWTDAGTASWYDFAIAIRDEALARGLLTRRVTIRPIRTAAYPTPAARPPYSILDTESTRSLIGLDAPHWRENLCRMLDERTDA
jgi:dTDP-4-dehydrorhamnose reductase